ncbi:MAG: RNA pyrophosphohydrolase [Alphaproteobacteria bacterium]|nr:RNA pyrophosphohydrolase [Alphaproteobacteria bacterium]
MNNNAPYRPNYRPCVGIMLVSKTGKIFTANRIDYPGDYWQMPQGGIESGEDILASAIRELKEETSIESTRLIYQHHDWLYYDLPDDLRERFWQGKYNGQKQKWCCFAFTGDETEINLDTDIPEFLEWKWRDIDELPNIIVPFKKQLYRQLVTIFKPHISHYLSS